jgi:hypothetical protein
MNETTLSMFIILTIFGIGYAWYIFMYPIKRTWLSVVIGTGAVGSASFIIIYNETGNLLAASTPIIGLILSGTPMIISQEAKAYFTRQLADTIKNGLKTEFEGGDYQ